MGTGTILLIITIIITLSSLLLLSKVEGEFEFDFVLLSLIIGIVLTGIVFLSTIVISSGWVESEIEVIETSLVGSSYLMTYEDDGESVLLKSNDTSVEFVGDNKKEKIIVSNNVIKENIISNLLEMSDEEEVKDKENSWKLEKGKIKKVNIKSNLLGGNKND